MKQTIDISPEKVAPIASAGIRFLNLETTLIPGNLKQQLAVLEVFLGGLGTGELVLATPPRAPVESDVKSDGAGEEPPKGQELTPEQLASMRDRANGARGQKSDDLDDVDPDCRQ